MNDQFAVSGGFFCRPITTDAAPPRRSAAPTPIAAAFAAWRNRRTKDATSPGARAATLAHDEAMPPTEPHGNIGNKQYVMTFPAGEYEAEDGDDVMKIYRVSTSGRELVAQVAPGTYSIVTDEGGAHLYRHADDEPDRIPLTDTPSRVGDNNNMYGALGRFNKRMTQLYTPDNHRPSRPCAAADPALLAYATKMKQFWNRGAA